MSEERANLIKRILPRVEDRFGIDYIDCREVAAVIRDCRNEIGEMHLENVSEIEEIDDYSYCARVSIAPKKEDEIQILIEIFLFDKQGEE